MVAVCRIILSPCKHRIRPASLAPHYRITTIPSNAATTPIVTSAERIENWRRKRSAAMPARAKTRAGYQRGK